MSGYVNGKVLDTLSEHANALASSAVASLEDEADRPSHFPFLTALNDFVLTVPRHHGWYREEPAVAERAGIRCTCAVVDSLALFFALVVLCYCRQSHSRSLQCTSLQTCFAPVSSVPPPPPSPPCSKAGQSWHLQVDELPLQNLKPEGVFRRITYMTFEDKIWFHQPECMYLGATYTLDSTEDNTSSHLNQNVSGFSWRIILF